MNCPGSLNDRKAFKHSGFDQVLDKLPPHCFIVGGAAYPASDRVLVPFSGAELTTSQDAYNFYHSKARSSIDQAFGIMVQTWGILWRPLGFRLARIGNTMDAIVRLHNFLRRRKAAVPRSQEGVTLPPEVRFRPDGGLEGGCYDTLPVLGRPLRKGADECAPREHIRTYLEQESIERPGFDPTSEAGGAL